MEIPNTLCSNVYDFAFCPEPCYDRLVDLADPEDWDPSNRILKNYLSFSFSRAVFLTERDVDQTAPSNLPLVFDDDRCLFNTGLYTRRYVSILLKSMEYPMDLSSFKRPNSQLSVPV